MPAIMSMARSRTVAVSFIAASFAPLTAAAQQPAQDYVAAAQEVWQTLADDFFDPGFGGVDREAARVRLLGRAADARTDSAFAQAVTGLLRELRASHVGFRRVPAPAAAPSSMQLRAENPVEWRPLADSAGYIRIRHFAVAGAGAAAASLSLDSAFTAFRALPVTVLDLRGNPGGALDLAAHLADRLFATPLEAGIFVTQAGLRSRGASRAAELPLHELPRLPVGDSVHGGNLRRMIERLGGAAMLLAGGGGGRPYEGTLVVLVDRRTASTAEAVAAALAERPGVILAGTRTAGAMLSSTAVVVAGGWELRYPDMDFITAGGVRLEGSGAVPDVDFTGDDLSVLLRQLGMP